MATEPSDAWAIDLHGVGVRRDRNWLIRDVSWRVPVGSLAVLLGPNGSGKSTVIQVVAGYQFPTTGSATVLGARFGSSDLAALRQRLRLVAPANAFSPEPRTRVVDVVLTGLAGTIAWMADATSEQRDLALRLLEELGLVDAQDRPYGTLSTGERLRCQMARALMVQPDLLLLDEPTAGLDFLARLQFLDVLDRLRRDQVARRTIILVTHHMEDIPSSADQALLLSQGRVGAAGSLPDVFTDSILTQVYGQPLAVQCDGGRWSIKSA